MRLFTKKQDFFELFDKVAANITNAAKILVAIMEHFTNLDNWAQEVHELEEQGDLLTHDIIKKLNKTLNAPIDREDIHEHGRDCRYHGGLANVLRTAFHDQAAIAADHHDRHGEHHGFDHP